MAKWDLSPDLDATRLKELRNPPSFEDIVKRIRTEMEVLCCHSDTAEISGFERVIYCIRVSQPSFDLLFNSGKGYRAAYYLSPHEGLQANDYIIRSLLSGLIASSHTTSAEKENNFITESLSSPSAKVCLAEPQPGICANCNGEWVTPHDEAAEILNDRWELGESIYAKWGRKAPFLTKIRVIGAFLNAKHDEFVPERKRHRARHIYESGWA